MLLRIYSSNAANVFLTEILEGKSPEFGNTYDLVNF